MTPPQSKKILDVIAEVLNLKEESQEYKELLDLAALSVISDELIEPDILSQLPAFFRTVRGEKPSERELKALIDKIKSTWSRQ